MAISGRLSRKLHETFGNDAAEDLVDWMREKDAQENHLRELIELRVSRSEARIDNRFAELRQEMQAGFARSDGLFGDLRRDMEVGFARVETKLEQRTGELMKWSFVFWMGSVVTLVGALVTMDRFVR